MNKKKNNININKIIFRSNKDKILNNVKVSKSDKWLIGGEIYSLELNKDIKIYRYLERDKKKTIVNTHFYIETIDSKENIKLITNKEIFYGKNTSRTTVSINTNMKILLKKTKKKYVKYSMNC